MNKLVFVTCDSDMTDEDRNILRNFLGHAGQKLGFTFLIMPDNAGILTKEEASNLLSGLKKITES